MSGSTLYEQLKAVLSGCGDGHHATAPRCGDTAGCLRSPPMTRRSSVYNARLMFVGVALASGGIAFYVPLMLSTVGLAHSGAWAAGILFGTNLGRLVGSHFASRHGVFTRRRGAIVANILLEGAALFSMAFLAAPWMLVAVATLAGLGSGLSFPGLKNYLLKLRDVDGARIFAGLSLALRLGMALGYLAGALVGAAHLTAVFTALLALFVGYAGFMGVAMRDIDAGAHDAAPALPAAAPAETPPTAAPPIALDVDITAMLLMNALFWFLTIQPTVTMSLYVPRFVPGLAVSTTYWVTTVTVLLLQMRVTRLARGTAGHLLFLGIGIACMAASFATLALAGGHILPVLAAAVLLALSQVFYSPSLDVLISGDARARGLDIGKTMARQLFWQNLGMMGGSLFAGVLFDVALRRDLPSLSWIVPGAGALALLALSTGTLRAPSARPARPESRP
jgi:DHA1 family multidrug resistance protein-like MFS transporter